MIVAVFSDVHGNLPALESFLSATKGTADAFVCLGDSVGYGPWNDECLEAIWSLPGIALLEGNHERYFRAGRVTEPAPTLVEVFFRWSFASFSRSDLIEQLPTQVQVGSFCGTHTLEGRRVYADTPVSVDRSYLIGHSHHQFSRLVGAHRLVNCGSVGQNRRFADLADFALLDTEIDEVRLCSVAYPVDLLIRELEARHYPKECIDYYRAKPRSA
ncbi:MAG TPA: metallophosphoesterase family protein [Anaeromyxobacteraceae bacterium]|nr:metallophosphoesterase family protein [Anaeromyxobacteraceae bacterium]